jgi:hypothetical protein
MLDLKWKYCPGNIVHETEMIFGRPTSYILEHPELMIFVDKTGSSTCQESDGHVGGQFCILPKDSSVKGMLGSVTDMHFTVLTFILLVPERPSCVQLY